MSQRLHSDHINAHQELQSNSSQPKPASEKYTNGNNSLTGVLIQFDLNQKRYLSALNMRRCGCVECFRGGFAVVHVILYLRWDFELLHHPQLKEAADSTLDEFEL